MPLLPCCCAHSCCSKSPVWAPHPSLMLSPGTLTPELSVLGQGSDTCCSLYSKAQCGVFSCNPCISQGHTCKIPPFPWKCPGTRGPQPKPSLWSQQPSLGPLLKSGSFLQALTHHVTMAPHLLGPLGDQTLKGNPWNEKMREHERQAYL